MKKICSIILALLFVSSNFSFAYNNCEPRPKCEDPLHEGESTYFGIGYQPSTQTTANTNTTTNSTITNQSACPGSPGCPGYEETMNSINNPSKPSVMGVSCEENQLVNGQCKLNIYDTLGIKKSVRNEGDPTSVGLFVQDIVLSATFFIGTLVTIALIVSGLMFIFAATSGKDPANAKKGIINSLIGLLIVVSSYVIIRLVQYIAKGF